MALIAKDNDISGLAEVDLTKVYSSYGRPALKRAALFTPHVVCD